MGKKIKCKNCGRMFEPKVSGEQFCSSLCRVTGKFIGGGGDTSKPLNEEQRKALEKKREKGLVPPSKKVEEKPKKIRNGDAKHPRVAAMFALPVEKRWKIAKDFTAEEKEYARRVMKRMLSDEKKMDAVAEWDGSSESEVSSSYEGISGGHLGESDDGSV